MNSHQMYDVIVVDDSASLRDLFGMVLKLNGYRVAFAENGRFAIDFFDAGNSARLILLDIMMPMLDGHGFLAWLRQYRQTHADAYRSKVIVLSSLAEEQMEADAAPLELVTSVLRKPIAVPTLLAAVKQAVPAPGCDA